MKQATIYCLILLGNLLYNMHMQRYIFEFLDIDSEDSLDLYTQAIQISIYTSVVSGLALSFIILTYLWSWMHKKPAPPKPEKKKKVQVRTEFTHPEDLYDKRALKKAFQEGITYEKGDNYYIRLRNSKDTSLELKLIADEWWNSKSRGYRPIYKGTG